MLFLENLDREYFVLIMLSLTKNLARKLNNVMSFSRKFRNRLHCLNHVDCDEKMEN